ncbi:glycosyl hydrolase [Actinoplanes sp. SE50]|uniref:GH12 family glycosyl hydrolase domain-containing protein n=1 Tax=unclassified Actinoplanes TaxID=2626549 RepID=UPI00023ECC31|nr:MULTISPECIES: cellulose binding domain-containing protein [unclassified Actinoplanes]AEV82093.1 cellulase [Actinoplanes sp. SE50/110]ATO80492.1 glycosyl hydrolase [Actinoplanes sp. SE50]SLL97899.1 glycosyl hydrolase [Actinoplanes sp. SE50/110]
MLVKRFVVPLAVVAVGAGAAVVGVLNADAAVTAGCAVTYTVGSRWNSGFTGDVEIRNTGGSAIDGWTLRFAFPSGQRLASGWSGTWTQTGATVTVTDAGWNRSIAAGATVSLGFNGTLGGPNAIPDAFVVNGMTCGTTPAATKTATAATTKTATATAAKTPTVTTTRTPTATAPPVKNCTDYAALVRGRYWVNNNTWGRADGAGSQCVWVNGRTGDNLSWGTDWTWSGDTTKVKSYAGAVLGWHWGWKTTGTGLPVRLSAGRSVRSSWNFTVTPKTSNIMNVSYDLWLHAMGNADWQDQPTDEVMVWLYRSGGAGPIGTRQATVMVGGTTWDLYKGNIGWNVYSFVRTSNTTSADLSLTDFTTDLAGRGWLDKTKYLSSVQAGTEVFTGSGRLDTSAYSVKIS